MRHVKFILAALTLTLIMSCKKDEEKENPPSSSTPTPCTIRLYKEQFAYNLEWCNVTYTDVDGVNHSNSVQMDMTVENVDFSQTFSITASAGLTTYNPGGSPPSTYYPQVCDWQLKKDGVVIDVQSVSNYNYQN